MVRRNLIILRHDVDRLPENALMMTETEEEYLLPPRWAGTRKSEVGKLKSEIGDQ